MVPNIGIVTTITALQSDRYITRVVLVPFVDSNLQHIGVIERMEADQALQLAMAGAHKAASLALAMDITPGTIKYDHDLILRKLQDLLPVATPQRIYISYSWLLLCTEMVNVDKLAPLLCKIMLYHAAPRPSWSEGPNGFSLAVF